MRNRLNDKAIREAMQSIFQTHPDLPSNPDGGESGEQDDALAKRRRLAREAFTALTCWFPGLRTKETTRAIAETALAAARDTGDPDMLRAVTAALPPCMAHALEGVGLAMSLDLLRVAMPMLDEGSGATTLYLGAQGGIRKADDLNPDEATKDLEEAVQRRLDDVFALEARHLPEGHDYAPEDIASGEQSLNEHAFVVGLILRRLANTILALTFPKLEDHKSDLIQDVVVLDIQLPDGGEERVIHATL